MTKRGTRRGHRLLALIGCAGLALVFAQTSSATLLLRYTFDEESGDALDTGAAPAANGAFMNNATRTSNTPGGFSANALDMISGGVSGRGNYVTAGDVDKVDGLAQFTLTTWLNLQGTPGGFDRLLAKQVAVSNFDGFSWNINTPNAGEISAGNFRFGIFIGGADTAFPYAQSDADTGADNQWKFFAITYDGTSTTETFKFYQGGVGESVSQLGSTIGNAAATAVSANDGDFALGFTSASTSAESAPPGFMDDARVYDEVLDLAALEQVRLENVPEPATMALLGLAGAMLLRRRRT